MNRKRIVTHGMDCTVVDMVLDNGDSLWLTIYKDGTIGICAKEEHQSAEVMLDKNDQQFLAGILQGLREEDGTVQ